MTRPLIRPRTTATFSPREKESPRPGRPLLVVIFSLSGGKGWTAPHDFTSGRGTGEGLLSAVSRTLFPDLSNYDCLPGRAGGLPTN